MASPRTTCRVARSDGHGGGVNGTASIAMVSAGSAAGTVGDRSETCGVARTRDSPRWPTACSAKCRKGRVDAERRAQARPRRGDGRARRTPPRPPLALHCEAPPGGTHDPRWGATTTANSCGGSWPRGSRGHRRNGRSSRPPAPRAALADRRWLVELEDSASSGSRRKRNSTSARYVQRSKQHASTPGAASGRVDVVRGGSRRPNARPAARRPHVAVRAWPRSGRRPDDPPRVGSGRRPGRHPAAGHAVPLPISRSAPSRRGRAAHQLMPDEALGRRGIHVLLRSS